MNLNRRQLLAWASGATAAAWSGCARQPIEEPSARYEFALQVAGANTAITGWGFFDAVKLIGEIGFRTTEV